MKESFSVDRVSAGDRRAVSAKAGKRDMRQKRPVVASIEQVEERAPQNRDFIRRGALRPEESRPLQHGAIIEMLKLEHEWVELGDDQANFSIAPEIDGCCHGGTNVR